jgi:serine/threonine-protein kinase HipA
MSARELIACLEGGEMGRVTQSTQGRLQFTYSANWLESERAYPLSLSMPLQRAPHPHRRIDTFLWGLLPDNASILHSWGRRFQVSSRNAFALMSHVGEDCAGAVQFLTPEQLDRRSEKRRDSVVWLSESEVGQRLRELRSDHSAWRLARDEGQFSLAGAQPKTALLQENGRWGIPSGRIPTTHILKPPNAQLDGFPENEHICLHLAQSLGLPVAESRVMQFDGEVAIVISRYDRVRTLAGWTRVHQEDLCQALGVPPARKYQKDGGPGARAILELLRVYSSAASRDEETFIDALALSWLTAATDAHAKNYSILITAGQQVRLAPLYDVSSVLPYAQFDVNRVKLAMKVGDRYRIQQVGLREWRKLAADLRLDADALVSRLTRMAQEIPDRLADIGREARAAGLAHPIMDRLITRLRGRSRLCAKQLRT